MSIIPKPYAAIAAVLLVAVVGLVAAVGLAPRSGVGVPDSSSTPTATTPSSTPTVAATAAPTTAPASTPAPTAPPALQGSWRAEISGRVSILTFTATNFTVSYLGGGSGRIEVVGDKLTFLGSRDPQCPNGGTYRWSIDGDKLHFEPVGTDPCPFQAEWAGNKTYTRYD